MNGKLSHQESLNATRPLKDISKAFKSLKNNAKLTYQDLEVLRTFIDEFTTVTTHPETVGNDVSRIVREVNCHHHTHTCQKYSDTCRFDFPKYPTPETIIATPASGKSEDVDKLLLKNKATLKKVKDVLLDDNQLKQILEEFDKDTENAGNEYKRNREERIRLLLEKAKVTFEDYITALKTSFSSFHLRS